ncbi:hypothetical protein [Synechocystis sp. PCC 7509]|uniref:hypothetical protein n=1 Tax=Synechocystis sp. PCC 7509 TaxID=927677 RepID=UPI0002AC13CB|nr:hypothetical protein [Synechocystis sp. PCC 7509]
MENWEKDFFKIVEDVTDEVEHFFVGVTEVVESFFEVSDAIAFQLQNTIITEFDLYLQEWAEPLFDVYTDLEDVMNDLEQPFPHLVEPTETRHPACKGCSNYHGQVYNGNLLVCGMHPYGWEDSNCPDWESSN